ncbi:MAG: hypothetical protein LBS83_02055 [Holosporales bacterium]|jgi:hypothetical protein|nr:hypothetical protein [Holosporales bacterium]
MFKMKHLLLISCLIGGSVIEAAEQVLEKGYPYFGIYKLPPSVLGPLIPRPVGRHPNCGESGFCGSILDIPEGHWGEESQISPKPHEDSSAEEIELQEKFSDSARLKYRRFEDSTANGHTPPSKEGYLQVLEDIYSPAEQMWNYNNEYYNFFGGTDTRPRNFIDN